ncbi:MAG: carbamoyltransferase HypF [Saprospiraceae bacterium]|nr:carbamoyltransferase HypF [Saprospiraceae bacterium]
MTHQEQYHIHIQGQVQGVGFRPLVYQLAEKKGWRGWISNGKDGVHLVLAMNRLEVENALNSIRNQLPSYARILNLHIHRIRAEVPADFQIHTSDDEAASELVLTPDRSMCPSCRAEIMDPDNRRAGYAFTTCLQCGPRYSITRSLPYDRERTTMAPFEVCPSCQREYEDPLDRRYFSQTNSCPDCAISLIWEDPRTQTQTRDPDRITDLAVAALHDGHILAVKGLSGYLLLTDASNPAAIQELRSRKHRPHKPFAIMYPDLAILEGDVHLTDKSRQILSSPEAPIVLCPKQMQIRSGIAITDIAPNLDQFGVFLPNTPLFALILKAFPYPIVATSANLSGSPMLFREADVRQGLASMADFFIHHNREILVPQDDSVIRMMDDDLEPLLLRRSRGYAPAYIHESFEDWDGSVLALGAHMKGAMAIQHRGLTHISQYLGNLESYEAEESYKQVVQHLLSVLDARPEVILTDNHPGYFTSRYGASLAKAAGVPLQTYGHHHAHFAAVLAEHQLLCDPEPTLGVIWDGTGFGDDGTMWGGEFFLHRNGDYHRLAHLKPFPLILGDKMAREPRLSALSLTEELPAGKELVDDLFPEKVIQFYRQVLRQDEHMMTSSMGRLFDGVSALLGLARIQTFEGQGAMYLETMAARAPHRSSYRWTTPDEGVLDWTELIDRIIRDRKAGRPTEEIADAFHTSLVYKIGQIAHATGVRRIALSGGVWQNAYLTERVIRTLGQEFTILRHTQLSPNDENIPLGQLALLWQEEQGLYLPNALSTNAIHSVI